MGRLQPLVLGGGNTLTVPSWYTSAPHRSAERSTELTPKSHAEALALSQGEREPENVGLVRQ